MITRTVLDTLANFGAVLGHGIHDQRTAKARSSSRKTPAKFHMEVETWLCPRGCQRFLLAATSVKLALFSSCMLRSVLYK